MLYWCWQEMSLRGQGMFSEFSKLARIPHGGFLDQVGSFNQFDGLTKAPLSTKVVIWTNVAILIQAALLTKRLPF